VFFIVSFLLVSQCSKVGMAFPPQEVKLLRAVPAHLNLMQLFDVVETQDDVYLIQEYINGCELFEYCIQNQALPEEKCKSFFSQIVRGVSWLHKHGIAHRDLSKKRLILMLLLTFLSFFFVSTETENILLDNTFTQLKIIDLGLSVFYKESNDLSTFCGSPDFAAPGT
jgi:serine/threonine protein kinase